MFVLAEYLSLVVPYMTTFLLFIRSGLKEKETILNLRVTKVLIVNCALISLSKRLGKM